MRPDPDSNGGEEMRLHVALLPLRVRLDQRVVTFLVSFFGPLPGTAPPPAGPPAASAAKDPVLPPLALGAPPPTDGEIFLAHVSSMSARNRGLKEGWIWGTENHPRTLSDLVVDAGVLKNACPGLQ